MNARTNTGELHSIKPKLDASGLHAKKLQKSLSYRASQAATGAARPEVIYTHAPTADIVDLFPAAKSTYTGMELLGSVDSLVDQCDRRSFDNDQSDF